jgi:plastocyanin
MCSGRVQGYVRGMDSTLTGSVIDPSRASAGAAKEQPSLTPLGRLTLAALLALAALGVLWQVLIFRAALPPIGTVQTVGSLAAAGLLTRRWRWVPGVAAVWCGLMAAANATYIVRNLGNPDHLGPFLLDLVGVPVMISGIVAGIATTVQNYRRAPVERQSPRWLPSTLVGGAGLILGAALVAMLPRPTTADLSSETLARLPGVTAEGMAFQFDRGEIHVKAGQLAVLRVANADGREHSFDIDEVDVHTNLPAGKTRLSLFTTTTAGSYTFYCGIPGHRDQMHGTLVVDP